jgi:hypothetical protein
VSGQHTPGPWSVGWQQGKCGATCPGSRPFVGGEEWPFELVGYGYETIAIVPKQAEGDRFTVVRGGAYEANARLIAAAPEMLAMLEEVAEGHALHSDILDLIAKARGAS